MSKQAVVRVREPWSTFLTGVRRKTAQMAVAAGTRIGDIQPASSAVSRESAAECSMSSGHSAAGVGQTPESTLGRHTHLGRARRPLVTGRREIPSLSALLRKGAYFFFPFFLPFFLAAFLFFLAMAPHLLSIVDLVLPSPDPGSTSRRMAGNGSSRFGIRTRTHSRSIYGSTQLGRAKCGTSILCLKKRKGIASARN